MITRLVVLICVSVVVRCDEPKAQDPTGFQAHNFFGAGGYDGFGKEIAPVHSYSGPSFDQGPIQPTVHAGSVKSLGAVGHGVSYGGHAGIGHGFGGVGHHSGYGHVGSYGHIGGYGHVGGHGHLGYGHSIGRPQMVYIKYPRRENKGKGDKGHMWKGWGDKGKGKDYDYDYDYHGKGHDYHYDYYDEKAEKGEKGSWFKGMEKGWKSMSKSWNKYMKSYEDYDDYGHDRPVKVIHAKPISVPNYGGSYGSGLALSHGNKAFGGHAGLSSYGAGHGIAHGAVPVSSGYAAPVAQATTYGGHGYKATPAVGGSVGHGAYGGYGYGGYGYGGLGGHGGLSHLHGKQVKVIQPTDHKYEDYDYEYDDGWMSKHYKKMQKEFDKAYKGFKGWFVKEDKGKDYKDYDEEKPMIVYNKPIYARQPYGPIPGYGLPGSFHSSHGYGNVVSANVKTPDVLLTGSSLGGGGVINAGPTQKVEVKGPVVSYGAPTVSYSAPTVTYGAPTKSHVGPVVTTYGAPSKSHGTPAKSYGAPSKSHGAPAKAYGAPSKSHHGTSHVTFSSSSKGRDHSIEHSKGKGGGSGGLVSSYSSH